MPSSVIQAHYEKLEQIAREFDALEGNLSTLVSAVARQVEELHHGWMGDAADAFFEEMESDIIPFLRRLVNALNQSAETTRKSGSIFHNAEQEAARLFSSSGGMESSRRPVASGGSKTWRNLPDKEKQLREALNSNKQAIRDQMNTMQDNSESSWVGTKSYPLLDVVKLYQLQQENLNLRQQLLNDELADIEQLKPANWYGLSNEQKLDVLNQIHDKFAEVYGSKTFDIQVEQLDEKSKSLGGFTSDSDQRIVIDTDSLDEPHTAVNNIVHESFHAFEFQVTEEERWRKLDIYTLLDPMGVDYIPQSQREAWLDNYGDYISSDDDYDKYRKQPIERDAFDAGDSAENHLFE